jgi:CRP-like cAMP-binding protein
MAKDVHARYQTWEHFAHDLAQAARKRSLRTRKFELPATEKFDLLRAMPFFQDFPDPELWEVLGFAQWERIPAETHIVRDGDEGSFFCLLIGGELKVAKNGRVLNLLSPGDCFGEMAVVTRRGGPRTADVIALSTANVVTIHRSALEGASESCRMHFYQGFLEVLANRLTVANQRLTAV